MMRNVAALTVVLLLASVALADTLSIQESGSIYLQSAGTYEIEQMYGTNLSHYNYSAPDNESISLSFGALNLPAYSVISSATISLSANPASGQVTGWQYQTYCANGTGYCGYFTSVYSIVSSAFTFVSDNSAGTGVQWSGGSGYVDLLAGGFGTDLLNNISITTRGFADLSTPSGNYVYPTAYNTDSENNIYAAQTVNFSGLLTVNYYVAPPPPVLPSVPEPASLLLMGTGLSGIAAILRRRKRA